ncbi:hypothetical protein COU36_00585 [Candidatus Micrarchaeota archaeon CG10_big_fil_rev_8_21_14_0_10_59_7]|nr:MAG: hypothetical protein COU36_00585 [Candidatus Micrarchaeota archaeon CG10_big_fil_rev_8_21_14_0_10_59_7]
MKKVRDVMRKGFISIDSNASVREACARMAEQCKPVLLVLDGGKLAGILTDGDMLRAFYLKVSTFARGDDEFYKMKEKVQALADTKVSDIMTLRPKTLSEDDDVSKAAETLRRFNLKRLPVVDFSGKPLGTVERLDVVMSVLE